MHLRDTFFPHIPYSANSAWLAQRKESPMAQTFEYSGNISNLTSHHGAVRSSTLCSSHSYNFAQLSQMIIARIHLTVLTVDKLHQMLLRVHYYSSQRLSQPAFASWQSNTGSCFLQPSNTLRKCVECWAINMSADTVHDFSRQHTLFASDPASHPDPATGFR